MSGIAHFKQKAAIYAAAQQAQRAIPQVGDQLHGRLQQPPPPPPPAPTANAALLQKAEMQRTEVGEVFQYAEIRRIIGMPIVMPMDRFELDAFQCENVMADAYNGGFRLWPIQCEAVLAFDIYEGGFLPIGVGWGKTLCSLMIASRAYKQGHKKILLLVPSQVLPQLTQSDMKWARVRVPFNVPVHVLSGAMGSHRLAVAKTGRKGLYILPYSCLSTRDSVELLDAIAPSLIIADEAHLLSKRTAARTRRFLAYVDQHKPKGVCLSGTITDKTIRDYYHLIRWTLGTNNPLPNSQRLADEWGAVIDSNAEEGAQTGPLAPLIAWANDHFPEDFPETIAGFRRAYQARLTTAPGVISSSENEIGTSLVIANEQVEGEQAPGWERLEELRKLVENDWITPNGDEIEYAVHKWKWLFELSAGFYNELVWPEPHVYAQRKGIGIEEATDVLARAQEHHAFGQEYARILRRWLQEKAKPGLDTPMLVGAEMERNGAAAVGDELYSAWLPWKRADFKDRPDRDAHAVRICPYKIYAVINWLERHPTLGQDKGAILWVWHQEIGRWLYDLLRERVPVVYCPAGDTANVAILDHDNARKIIVASISAHGTGKNLQHFEYQYVVQWPRQARTAEQMLGRTHRNGQKADELIVQTNNTTDMDLLNFAACLNDACYIQQTTGNRQKVMYASYDPVPRIIPSTVLHERGAQNRLLDAQQQALLDERFGG